MSNKSNQSPLSSTLNDCPRSTAPSSPATSDPPRLPTKNQSIAKKQQQQRSSPPPSPLAAAPQVVASRSNNENIETPLIGNPSSFAGVGTNEPTAKNDNNDDRVLSPHEEQEMIDAVEQIEKTVEAWRQFSGMHTILSELEANKDRPMDVNDLTLAMATGVDAASEQAVNGVLESAVVAALLLSFSLPLIVDPPDAIAELDNGDWRKILHLVGWGAVSIVTVANILYARIYTTAIARAVRCSDKLRIHLAGNAFNEGLLMVYATFGCLIVAVLPDCLVVYGNVAGSIFTAACAVGGGCAVTMACKYIAAGHVEYGWRLNRFKRQDPVNDMMLFETLKQRINYAQRLKQADKPFFQYDTKRASKTLAQGISPEGQELFFEQTCKKEV
ncbi:hypothetical protein ACA910_017910 [Epithemia clementina (nom. ined.)]